MIDELSAAFAAALDGPDVESHYECAHCGTVADEWSDDCPRCGGAVMRIVTSSEEERVCQTRD
ncbi:hypothetical protein [Halorussus amylolyticus]|uniref:hypothetical protein n=1 Tax=Halorussus amylolyticus TaxID=1126242 RepID=UPI00104FC0C3|nr:hypothetical protein [Halorussus amylolyticus]